ncbi:MAG TPA: aldo/keto reductase [Ktedonobacteraceae bacterium]|nr:aldo/keto reductase [Ktedonobacteraceae bacterium]
MHYRQFGRIGMQVSPLCLGSMLFGGKTPEAEAHKIIDNALDAGINMLDTANIYERGQSETVIGTALKQNGKRAKVVLATKVWGRMDDHDPNAAGLHRRHIREQCEASLRRLQTDYIDVYYVHRQMQNIPIDETLRALDDLIHSGKVLSIGCSTFSAWSVVESLWVAKEYGLNRFCCEQPPYHLLDRSIENELIPMARTYGLALMAWSPLAGGLLTGKYQRGIPETGRIQAGSRWGDRHLTPAVLEAVGALEQIAQEKECTLSQLALAWCVSRPGITGAVLGARTLEHLIEQLKSLDVSLTETDHQRIDSICPPGKTLVSYYYEDTSADFRPAQYRW